MPPLELRFLAGGSCEIEVVATDTPARDRVVVLEQVAGGKDARSLVTDPRGVARFEHLAPGSYRARAVMAGQPTVACTVEAGHTSFARITASRLAAAQP